MRGLFRYERVARAFASVAKVVIAKFDATANTVDSR
jgi:hypothetical protein